LGLPRSAWSLDGVEFHGAVSLLKAGLWYADWITTVSPTYAEEIRTEEAGMGFDGLLRARANVLSGILNGIDTAIWNPASDPLIEAQYESDTISDRSKNKAALQARLGIAQDAAAPLFGVVSRLTWQKGMDLLLTCLPVLRALGAQLVVVGAGDSEFEAAFRIAAAEAPDRIGCFIGYDEALAHTVQAGADALLLPSRFEPCGLTQLCALRYGAVPVVARVGGLADTVIDANTAALMAGVATGVQFTPTTADALEAALRRTVTLYRDQTGWRALQLNGMRADVSWTGPARRYAALYRDLVAARVR
jgi:starch synthase